MRKFMLLFAVAGLMIFTLSVSALGATQLYLDYIATGEVEDADLSGFGAGLDYQLNDQFKLGVELLFGEIELDDDDADYNHTFVKGGYKMTDKVYATVAYADATLEQESLEVCYTGLLIGAEVDYELAENIVFNGSLGISISGEYEAWKSGYDWGAFSGDADLTIIKLKLNYLFSDNIGASLGYNSFSVDTDDSETEVTYITLGAVYKF